MSVGDIALIVRLRSAAESGDYPRSTRKLLAEAADALTIRRNGLCGTFTAQRIGHGPSRGIKFSFSAIHCGTLYRVDRWMMELEARRVRNFNSLFWAIFRGLRLELDTAITAGGFR